MIPLLAGIVMEQFILGLFIGSAIGFFVAGLMRAAKDDR